MSPSLRSGCLVVMSLGIAGSVGAQERTVAQVHAALAAGELTCQALVQSYLGRIEAYDDRGPRLNAILTLNPRALSEAAQMDLARSAGAATGPLQCIPVILKDNYGTADLPTTGGSRTLASSVPPRDAFVVRRLREAGAIVLAKANLHELAFSGTTVSSLGGQTLNPYDLTRTPGGSSGGTGAAIAADFGVIGTGSDTGQSIRSPASANSLVGLRSTRGLISRAGIIPVSSTQDEAGPITRTVEDAARFLDAVVGYDPDDPITAFGVGRTPSSYLLSLSPDALRGARIGLLVDFLGQEPVHGEVNAVVEEAVRRMEQAGASVIRIRIPRIAELTRDLSLINYEFKVAFESYLSELGEAAPVKTLAELVGRGEIHPSLRAGLEEALRGGNGGEQELRTRVLRRTDLRQAVMTALVSDRLDAILYPHQKRLVATIGEEQLERNGVLSNATGFPAITFPGGFSPATSTAPVGVPVGIELLGPEWSEPRLLALAYAFEQSARVRRSPTSTPPLR
jgi:Asp-tRNA(Asn)/Glu-tRNA(Gln) amidotransferase A subunit family amidase